jgi:hypothetical protein
MALGLTLTAGEMYFIPAFMSASLAILTVLLHFDSKSKKTKLIF